MNRFVSLLGVAMLMVGLSGCWGNDHKQNEEKAKAAANLRVINVLEKEYYDDAHIKGSVNVPLMQLKTYAAGLDKNTELVVYCANYACSASGAACKELLQMGFKHVWAYEGGTAEWLQLGFPIAGPAQQEYLRAPNEPSDAGEMQVPTINAVDLKSKMVAAGLL